MLSWWRKIWSRWRAREKAIVARSHLGGRDIPKILGICQECGAVVVEGLHQITPRGYLCQRCANSRRSKNNK
ncbi:hypothetical protein [Desulfobacca acetoxidans]|uniref:hypothetical protein n=1 Tax=Desulfobacca acetoxidans TaxID=60893 RepID=UPI0011D18423|nr:hypothetical protein [Desulfobacca acetoxidans]